MKRLGNRTVVITGGGSGIGAATARRVVNEGGSVVIVDRDVTAGSRVATELGGTFAEADLSDRGSITALCTRLASEFAAIHGLVNNAGIVRPSAFADLTDDNWDVQLSILLTAPAFLVRGLLPSLAAGHASIVNISSEGGFRPRDSHTAYDVSKAGIAALARSLAAELGSRGIRANSIAPGWIASEMHFGTGPDAAAKRQALLERENSDNILNRLGRPEEIASVVAFLLSDDASFLTGTCIHADGGMGLG